MTGGLAAAALAWVPFLHPLRLPAGARLWMLLPLVLCVAAVYRATRARRAADLPRPTAWTFVNILAGMAAIALAFYVVQQLALRFF